MFVYIIGFNVRDVAFLSVSMKLLLAVLYHSAFVLGLINIALIHSFSGSYFNSANGILDAEILAIEELNSQGGILGNQVIHRVYDGESDCSNYETIGLSASQNQSISATFATSPGACKENLFKAYQKTNQSLWYSSPPEGQECQPNVFFTGGVVSQLLNHTIGYTLSHSHKKICMISGDDSQGLKFREIMEQVANRTGMTKPSSLTLLHSHVRNDNFSDIKISAYFDQLKMK
jgi:ABC-type branched-subunit amino acid transport system substrate-binding protein